MLKCANGHLRTLRLRPRPPLPRVPRRASRYVSCARIRPRSRAPALLLETSRRRPMTGRGVGNTRRADRHANVTLKATTAATAREGTGASSSVTRGARLRPDAAPRRGATGTLAKSRIFHQYRQSKKKLYMNGGGKKRCTSIYMDIYIII